MSATHHPATVDDIRTTLVETVARDTDLDIEHGSLVVAAEYRHGVDHTHVEAALDDMEAGGDLVCETDALGTPRWRLP